MDDCIVYTLIANKGNSVVCEYSDKLGNFAQISRVLLSKEIKLNERQIFKAGSYSFYSLNEKGITFMCLCRGLDDTSIMMYLGEIRNTLFKIYSFERVECAIALEFSTFSKSIKEIKEYYEARPRISISGDLISKIQETRVVDIRNISGLLDKNGGLEIIVKMPRVGGEKDFFSYSKLVSKPIKVIKKDSSSRPISEKKYIILGLAVIVILLIYIF